jgi:hypothetical protein
LASQQINLHANPRLDRSQDQIDSFAEGKLPFAVAQLLRAGYAQQKFKFNDEGSSS